MSNAPLYWLGGTLIVLVSLLVYVGLNENMEWEKFKTTHQCKVAATKDSEIFNTVDTSGKVAIGFTSSQTAWLCDDNVTYWK